MFPHSPYEASNKSYKQFRGEYVYLNALYYLIVQCKDDLKKKLTDGLNQGGVAIGMVTHAKSNKEIQGVFIHQSDAKIMEGDFEGFIKLTNQQVFISSHRMLVNYLHNLLIELNDKGLIKLLESEAESLMDYGISSKNIVKIYNSINIKITTDDLELKQLKRLSATRNIIEHNSGKVNSEYLTLTGYKLNLGDNALVEFKEVGEALAITEHIAQNVNARALEKWPQLLQI